MDFSEIQNVNDLISQNDKAIDDNELRENLLKPIYDEDPEVGLQCALHILYNLLSFHSNTMEMNIEQSDAKMSSIWAIDTAKIDMAITLLKDIQL